MSTASAPSPLWSPPSPKHVSCDAPGNHGAEAAHMTSDGCWSDLRDVAHCDSPTLCTHLAGVLTVLPPSCKPCAHIYTHLGTVHIYSHSSVITLIECRLER